MSTTTKERTRPPKVTMAVVDASKRPIGKTAILLRVIKALRAIHKANEAALIEFMTTARNELLHSPEDVVQSTSDFVVLARDAYERLVEDAEDRAATEAYHRAAGEERVPAEVVDRLLAGESPIRVWREHRKMTLDQLGAATGLSKGYLSDLENGKRAGPVETLHTIARALGVSLDELAPARDER